MIVEQLTKETVVRICFRLLITLAHVKFLTRHRQCPCNKSMLCLWRSLGKRVKFAIGKIFCTERSHLQQHSWTYHQCVGSRGTEPTWSAFFCVCSTSIATRCIDDKRLLLIDWASTIDHMHDVRIMRKYSTRVLQHVDWHAAC